MESKSRVLTLTLALLAAPVAARADIISELHGDTAVFQMTFGDHERCDADSLALTAFDATAQNVATGPSREAYGAARVEEWAEFLSVTLLTHDEDCQPVSEEIDRFGLDLEITLLDGSNVEILDCVDENGEDPTRSCEIDGLQIAGNAFALQGTYIFPSGRTLTFDMTITKTNDTVQTIHLLSTPVLIREAVEFKSRGSVNDRLSLMVKTPADIANAQAVGYSGSVTGSVLLDGQPLVADPGFIAELGTAVSHENHPFP